jgi:hypothetical protein
MPAARTVDVQTFLNEHPFSRFQWVIFGLCFWVVLLDGFDTTAIGYIAPSLITEWGLERPALAPVLSAALFGLAAGALSSGPLADRLGRKAVLMGSVLIMGAACLMSAFAGSLDQLVIWRFITGLGLGAAMPNAVTLMSEYCPDGRRATLTNAVLRLSVGCGFRWLSRCLDDTAVGLAKRPGARRDHAADLNRADGPSAAGVCALHGCQEPAGRAHSQRAASHRRNGARRNLVYHARKSGSDRSQKWHRHGGLELLSHGLGEFVGGLFHGLGDLLRADQLDAAPVQGCGVGAADRLAHLGPVPTRRRRRDPLWLADGSLQCQRYHRSRFRADRRGRLCDRPNGRQPRTAGGGGIRGRHPHEHVPIVATRTGRRLLSYAGARDRRGLDAGPGPLWWNCRLLSRGRARAPATALQRDLCGRGYPGLDRRGGADGQADRASRRHGGSRSCKGQRAESLMLEGCVARPVIADLREQTHACLLMARLRHPTMSALWSLSEEEPT